MKWSGYKEDWECWLRDCTIVLFLLDLVNRKVSVDTLCCDVLSKSFGVGRDVVRGYYYVLCDSLSYMGKVSDIGILFDRIVGPNPDVLIRIAEYLRVHGG